MSHECSPEEVALKTFFLGPKAENREWVEKQILNMFRDWFKWREHFAPEDGRAISDQDRQLVEYRVRQQKIEFYLKELEQRFAGEIPKFNPRYIAHMFSEFSLPALLGHVLTLLHNPNNISGEVSRVGIQLEKEAIQDLSRMAGYHPQKSMGHFTSGGTVANFEGIVRAKARLNQWLELATFAKETQRFDGTLMEAAHLGWEKFDQIRATCDLEQFAQWRHQYCRNNFVWMKKVSEVFQCEYSGPVILLPASCHYSWPKAVQLFGDGMDRLEWIPLNSHGRLCTKSLVEKLQELEERQQPIWAVVSVAGTTELGVIDPIEEIQNILENYNSRWHLWHHVDAAYGGFLCSLMRPTMSKEFPTLYPLMGLARANSITIDPHKLGYVPYASGVILVGAKRDYSYLKIHAPYIQFDPNDDVGLQTLEGSRSAAGAAATWLTDKTIGLNSEGYGKILGRTIKVTHDLARALKESGLPISISPTIDSNVLVFTYQKKGSSLSESNQWVQKIYEKFGPHAQAEFIVSKTSLDVEKHRSFIAHWISGWNGNIDVPQMDLIRLCLMNPFFETKESKVSYQDEFIRCLGEVFK
jgi:glutamate/tyrosine decarboxylase-like PLP-dependent enzyme